MSTRDDGNSIEFDCNFRSSIDLQTIDANTVVPTSRKPRTSGKLYHGPQYDSMSDSDAPKSVASPPIYHSLVAGGCAAVASRVFTLPPDTIKARQQVSSIYKGTKDAFVKIVRQEGVKGLYPGFLPLLMTVVPANMCYFGGYELGKRITPSEWGPGRDMATAIIAQSLAGVAYCPIDIVKQTVQTATVIQGGESRMANPWHAARTIWSAQGVKGFYRGFVAMNCLWMPWNLIYLTLYEASKRNVHEYRRREGAHSGATQRYVRGEGGKDGVEVFEVSPRSLAEELPVWSYPLCSSVAAAVAALATHPIDCIKTNMQVLSAQTGKRQAASTIARELWRTRGLMKGWSGMYRWSHWTLQSFGSSEWPWQRQIVSVHKKKPAISISLTHFHARPNCSSHSACAHDGDWNLCELGDVRIDQTGSRDPRWPTKWGLMICDADKHTIHPFQLPCQRADHRRGNQD